LNEDEVRIKEFTKIGFDDLFVGDSIIDKVGSALEFRLRLLDRFDSFSDNRCGGIGIIRVEIVKDILRLGILHIKSNSVFLLNGFQTTRNLVKFKMSNCIKFIIPWSDLVDISEESKNSRSNNSRLKLKEFSLSEDIS